MTKAAPIYCFVVTPEGRDRAGGGLIGGTAIAARLTVHGINHLALQVESHCIG